MTIPQQMIGMSEIHIAKGPVKMICLGLGSCIGFCLYDPTTNITGMVHIMLPSSNNHDVKDKLGKYADTAIPELLRQLDKAGVNKDKLIAVYSGGAHVFQFSTQQDSTLDVGKRNAESVQQIYKNLGLRCVANDIGGKHGRTFSFCSETKIFTVKTLIEGEKTLYALQQPMQRSA